MDVKTTFRNLVRDQSVSICMLQDKRLVSKLLDKTEHELFMMAARSGTVRMK